MEASPSANTGGKAGRTSTLSATASASWVEIIANEIRGADIPPEAQNARMLAKAWGLSTKGAYNKCEELVKNGVLAFVEGKREGDQRKSRYYYPSLKK